MDEAENLTPAPAHPNPRLAPVMYADGRLTRRGLAWIAGLGLGMLLNLSFCGLLAGRMMELFQPTINLVALRMFGPPGPVIIGPTPLRAGPVPGVTVVYIVPTPIP